MQMPSQRMLEDFQLQKNSWGIIEVFAERANEFGGSQSHGQGRHGLLSNSGFRCHDDFEQLSLNAEQTVQLFVDRPSMDVVIVLIHVSLSIDEISTMNKQAKDHLTFLGLFVR